jgi:hypothetical protein
MIRVHESGGVSSIATLRVRESAGLSTIAYMRVREATGVSTVFTAGGGAGSFNVNALPTTPFGGAASPSAVSVTTEVVTVTATGGVAPYTFAWVDIDGFSGWSIAVVGDGQARFTRAATGPGDSETNNFKCEVTDAAGRKVDSPTIAATVVNYGRF